MKSRDEFYLPEEVIEWLGLKKSQYLSKLIENLAADDFSFEEFHQFDHLIPQTLEAPESIYKWVEDGYELKTYVRSYFQKDSFQQIIVGVLLPDKASSAVVLVPILTLVSKKANLLKLFTLGEAEKKPVLN